MSASTASGSNPSSSTAHSVTNEEKPNKKYVTEISIITNLYGLPANEFLRSNSNARCIIKLRGLPWDVSENEIVYFFDDCKIKNGTKGVHLIMTKEGRPSGMAYVEMETEDDMELAYKKDGQYLHDRYIEVFRASRGEMQRTLRRSELSIHRAMTDACVRIRGLPYKTSEQDILNFFEGLDVIPNGVSLIYDDQGRTKGEAYVQFRDQQEAERALRRDKARLNHRYIEVFKSSLGELRLAQLKQRYANQAASGAHQNIHNSRGPMMNNYGGYQILRPLRFSGYPERFGKGGWNYARDPRYDRSYPNHQESGRTRFQENKDAGNYQLYALHMRGLPFDTTRAEIVEFFSPLKPIEIDIHYNAKGKATGQADVTFETREDLEEALTKNNKYLRHRYVELFE